MVNFDKYFLRELVEYAGKNGELVTDSFLDKQVKIMSYYYPIKDIAEEVYKRTSYIGRSRPTEEGNHILKLVAMTRDEGDIFESYLQDAVVTIYDSICCYGRTIAQSIIFDQFSNTIALKENNGIDAQVTFGTETFNPTTSEVEIPYTLILSNQPTPNDAIKLKTSLVYMVKDSMGLLEERETKQFEFTLNAEGGTINIPIDVDTTPSTIVGVKPEEFRRIVLHTHLLKVESVAPVELKKDDWVELTKLDGTKELYRILMDCNSNDVGNPILFSRSNDYRNSIHYIIMQPKMFNENAIMGVDVAIFNALVHYIMYLWFLVVLPKEAEIALMEYNRHINNLKQRLDYKVKPIIGKSRFF